MEAAKEGNQIILHIDDLSEDGRGIGKHDGFAFFAENSLPGETVEIKVTKVKKNYGEGTLVRILSKSPDRVEPVCTSYSQCGGCDLLHLRYEAQLAWKEKRVKDCLVRIGGCAGGDYRPIIGMDEPNRYRNKMACGVSQNIKPVCVGMFARQSHTVIDSSHCILHDDDSVRIMAAVERWVNDHDFAREGNGEPQNLLRHVVTRRSYDGSIMVVLVSAKRNFPHIDELVTVLRQFPNVKSIMLNINTRSGQVILGDQEILLWGKDHLEEVIGGLKFSVSAQSFFQVNRLQAEKLYSAAFEMAALTGTETVYDLYCGTGTITQLLAQKAGKAIGIESVTEAVEDAKRSAAANSSKALFYAGKAEELFPVLANEDPPHAVVLDPPRKGCEETLLQSIIRVKPDRVVYVSCNPATLARDVAVLTKGGYSLLTVQPVDMFPHTTHVECTVLMCASSQTNRF